MAEYAHIRRAREVTRKYWRIAERSGTKMWNKCETVVNHYSLAFSRTADCYERLQHCSQCYRPPTRNESTGGMPRNSGPKEPLYGANHPRLQQVDVFQHRNSGAVYDGVLSIPTTQMQTARIRSARFRWPGAWTLPCTTSVVPNV